MLSKDKDCIKNQAISPYSFSHVFGILANCVDNETQKQMLNILGFPNDIDEYNKNSKDCYDLIVSGSKENKENFLVKNFIFYRNDVKIREIIRNDFFNTKLVSFDPSNIKQEIVNFNNLISKVTYGNIQNALDTLSPDIPLLIMNVLHIDLTWVNIFRNSGLKKFKKLNGDTVKQIMMHQISDFDTYEDEKKIAIKMPYKYSNLSFVAVMPKNLLDWELDSVNNFSEDSFNDIISKMTRKIVNLSFPKFKYEYSINFDEHIKDFELDIILKNLKLDKTNDITIKQKVVIDVNMNGAIASAVGLLHFMDSGRVPKVTYSFDQPFFWFIARHSEDKQTNTPIFMGKFLGNSLN
ncbi:serpin-type proteinase inhibitor 2 [Vairimorpha necatrix]|uniref:Serpin-type proteinase inhibitor 2 n=1 Tax=Vairimorpha necatrix TaxID=6039 RepID=A0AAX4JBK2_9MICR